MKREILPKATTAYYVPLSFFKMGLLNSKIKAMSQEPNFPLTTRVSTTRGPVIVDNKVTGEKRQLNGEISPGSWSLEWRFSWRFDHGYLPNLPCCFCIHSSYPHSSIVIQWLKIYYNKPEANTYRMDVGKVPSLHLISLWETQTWRTIYKIVSG